jgi:hypothetical protein
VKPRWDLIISLAVGTLVALAAWAISFLVFFSAVWGSIHGAGPSEPGLLAMSLVGLVVPPAFGVLCGRMIYRWMGDTPGKAA